MLHFTFELEDGSQDYLITDSYYQWRKKEYDYEYFGKIIDCSEAVKGYRPGFSLAREIYDEDYTFTVKRVIITAIDNTIIRLVNSHFSNSIKLRCSKMTHDKSLSGFICYDAVSSTGELLFSQEFLKDKDGYAVNLDYGFSVDTIKLY